MIPSWKSREVGFILCLTVLLFCRTLLSIYIASVNGRIVKAIVNTDLKAFFETRSKSHSYISPFFLYNQWD